MGMNKSEDKAAVILQSPERAADAPAPAQVKASDSAAADEKDAKETKEKKRNKLFGLVSAKKKSESSPSQSPSLLGSQQPQQQPPSQSQAASTTSPSTPPTNLINNTSKLSATMTSPSQSDYLPHPQSSHMSPPMPSSPSRGLSSSPRIVSPASSQIFERDVQDSVVLQPNSPAIPAHIKTENYIPPVLDASSEAITDDHLDPDSVEIITHASHQPAAAAFASTGSHTPHPMSPGEGTWADELAASYVGSNMGGLDREDSASNYGSIDTTDVRRLSFISFADVVLSEQVGHGSGPSASRDSIHIAGLTSLSSHRSPSPIRSPVSSQGPGTSPPTSSPGSMKGVDMSPQRKPIGSPTPSHPTLVLSAGNGELSIETMSQALRRTGSTDMSALRSIPTSPVEGSSQ